MTREDIKRFDFRIGPFSGPRQPIKLAPCQQEAAKLIEAYFKAFRGELFKRAL